jgi:phospholipase A1
MKDRKNRGMGIRVSSGLVSFLVMFTDVSFGLNTEIDQCLIDTLKTVDGHTTVEEVMTLCRDDAVDDLHVGEPALNEELTEVKKDDVQQTSIIDARLNQEKQLENQVWAMTPHRPNYLLPFSYNEKLNNEPFESFANSENLEELEAKFQISFKFPLYANFLADDVDLYFAFTNQSWWQVYSPDASSPFRENSYEPEFFWRLKTNWNKWGMNGSLIDLGFVHQSNGRAGSLSRSWNRLYANFVFDRGNMAYSVKPWLIVGETNENPDIEEFFGYGEFRVAYVHDQHTIAGMLRNNFKSDENKGAVELTWSHPLSGKIRAYAQYFYGYGESLLDYDVRTNRIGIGIAINDYVHGE